MSSPCIDVCRYDEATGWCFGCGMTKPEKKLWKREKSERPDIAAVLPGRLVRMAMAGQTIGEAAKKKR